MEDKVVKTFDEIYPYIRTDIRRSLILPDANFPPKMIVGIEHLTGDTITVFKDIRPTIPQTINPRRDPNEEMIL